jgi:serine/threonine-protein kinase
MNADRWNRIEALFEQAAELGPAERAAFLEEVCAGDLALREEVEALLAADADAEGYLGRLSVNLVGPALESALAQRDALVGSEVGSYRVLRPLGHGGMGTVYLAERIDGSFTQTVALKVVRAGLSPALSARFRAERRILARLQHPNIARLLDGGVAPDGRPWLAMEYVEGEPITAYCDRKRLSVNERLALFETVCETVAFAHRNLVVHRDLKPSNILVTTEGTVKLLDFGIAKLMEDEAPFTVAETRTGMRVMTPEYAAPEQVRGEAVSTATDVYALGVLLYELLTGRRPYRLSTQIRHEIERAILEDEPTRPSTAVAEPLPEEAPTTTPDTLSQARQADTAALRRRLAGDLDQIVLTALRKETERRYGSADAFADDIRRHLDGLPVKAQPDTVGYRARKFVRRHRGGVAATALVVLALAVGLGAALWQADRAEAAAARAAAEAERAQLETEKAEQVAALLTQVFSAADPYSAEGPEAPVGRVLEAGAEQLRSELAAQPAVLAAMLEVLGRIETNWGRYEKARPLLEEAYAIADSGAVVTPSVRVAVLQSLASLRHDSGEYEAAEELMREAVAVQTARFGPEDDAVASAYNDLARNVQAQGRLDEAADLYRRAIVIRRQAEPSPDLAANLNNLANLLADLKDYEAAIPLYVEAREIVEEQLGPDHPYNGFIASALSIAYKDLGEEEQALAEAERAVTIGREQLGNEHPFTASAVYNRGSILHDVGRMGEARVAYEESLALRRQLYPDGHPEVAFSLGGLGTLLIDLGQPDLAEPYLREALVLREQALDGPHWLLALTRGHLGRALMGQGRYAEAEPFLLTAYEDTASEYGSDDEQSQKAAGFLVALYEAWGKPQQAAAFRTRAGTSR